MPRPGTTCTIFAILLTAVVLLACQPDTAGDAAAEGDMDAEHEESAESHEVHWSYEGDTGPAMWGSLDPSFAACDDGVRQSPVDITGAVAGGESPISTITFFVSVAR